MKLTLRLVALDCAQVENLESDDAGSWTLNQSANPTETALFLATSSRNDSSCAAMNSSAAIGIAICLVDHLLSVHLQEIRS